MVRQLSLVVAALVAGAPVQAQDQTGKIDEIFSWATQTSPGCNVAVSQHGKRLVNRSYGLADVERGVRVHSRTIIDIGSTQSDATSNP